GPLSVGRLGEGNSPTRVPVQVELIGAFRPPMPIPLRIFDADPQWLKTELKGTPIKMPAADAGASAGTAFLELAVPPAAHQWPQGPRGGVLVQAQWAGRTYHRRLDVPLTGRAETVQLLVSGSPSGAAPVSDAVLRPGTTRQAFFLFVRNQGEGPRKVTVE